MVLGTGITDGKLLLFHGISEQSKDKTISMIEYNHRTVYDCFNNKFSVDCGRPAVNLPPIPIDYSPHPKKRARYTYDPLPDAISVTSRNSISILTTPYDPPQLLEPNYDEPDTKHTIMSDNPCRNRTERRYCSRFHDGKRCYKNRGSIAPYVQLKRGFITVIELP